MVENNVESVRENDRYLETIINRKKRTIPIALKCTLCQGHYDFSFSDFYFIFVCCVVASK